MKNTTATLNFSSPFSANDFFKEFEKAFISIGAATSVAEFIDINSPITLELQEIERKIWSLNDQLKPSLVLQKTSPEAENKRNFYLHKRSLL